MRKTTFLLTYGTKAIRFIKIGSLVTLFLLEKWVRYQNKPKPSVRSLIGSIYEKWGVQA